MMSPTGINRIKSGRSKAGHRAGFTLVELMLVMALLLIVMAVSFPSLKGFFKGRNLDSEARRFLSLTHFAQSRAVSDGMPMELWVDSKARKYGLRAAAGFVETDRKAVEFGLAEDLQVEVGAAATPIRTSQMSQTSQTRQSGSASLTKGGPMIRFYPDGSIGEGSPERIIFRQKEGDGLGLVESGDHVKYEIQEVPKSRK